MSVAGATLGSLFSGIGGLDIGLEWLGYQTIWQAENDPTASRILEKRMPGMPNLGDLTAVDWSKVVRPDVLAGGFPCQGISNAGKRKGLEDERSGLWSEFARAIRELQPTYVVVENAAALRNRGLSRVLGDLASLGFDGEWGCIRASEAAGACHRRDRMFIVASDPSRELLHRPCPADRGRWSKLTNGDQRALDPLPTPSAVSYGSNQGGSAGRVGLIRHGLSAIDKLLPTPTVNDSRGGRNITANRSAEYPKNNSGWTLCDVAYAVDWGKYEGAIRRWEQIHGTAPNPRTPDNRLSADFVEWMMGLPDGWTRIDGISKTSRLKVLGNTVVPHHVYIAAQLLGLPNLNVETR